MKKHQFNDEFGCLGEFGNRILCKKYCALRLRCALEAQENKNLDFIEDMQTLMGDDCMIIQT